MARKTILSGIQATGTPHLGNYLGAIVRWVDAQNEDINRFFMIADLHALTVPRDPGELRDARARTAAGLLASGIDIAKSTLFMQSQVAEHSELQWLLSSVTQLGELNRMTQFKEKGQKVTEAQGAVSLALFAYPTLQAADILIYEATHVPVGEDQRQHVELTRTIARRFNTRYETSLFIEPEAEVPAEAARVMDLQRPDSKMSKSSSEASGIIFINDPDDVIVKKIKRAVTDTNPGVDPENAGPGVRNLLEIFAAATGKELSLVHDECAGMRYGDFKTTVASAVVEVVNPIRERFETLMGDQGELHSLLSKGAEQARETAAPFLERAKAAMGLEQLPHPPLRRPRRRP